MRLLLALVAVVALSACRSSQASVDVPDEGSQVAPEPVAVAPADEGSGAPPPRATIEHTVVAGDTLWSLGRRYGCRTQELRDANGLSGDTIHAGRTLLIPPCEAESTPPPTPPAQGGTYQVQSGDYLELIAERVGCSVPQLMDANGLVNDVIYAEQVLNIPTCEGSGAEGSAEPAPDPDGTWRVRGGEYLGIIAARTNCTVNELMVANGLTSERINAGQRLQIPTCAGGRSVYADYDPTGGGAVATGTGTAPRPQSDATSLVALMRERGFRPPSRFKAYVIEITFTADRTAIERERRFDYDGTGDDTTGWNAASTVKLFAAIAAMQRAQALGFGLDVEIEFRGSRTYTHTLRSLVADAVGPSSNIAYDFLVTFVGFDELNRDFFTSRNGLAGTALRRAYESSRWMDMGFSSSFAVSPPLVLREGTRTREIDARTGSHDTGCYAAACTSLRDLAEAMRRVMLQEQLPSNQSYGLNDENLRFLRQTLRSERARGEEVVDGLARGDFAENTRFYHKAGFAGDWFSDNVYIFEPGSRQAWVVAMAGYPGRSSLNSAAAILGDIIASGALADLP
jgi:LysM repeat protein